VSSGYQSPEVIDSIVQKNLQFKERVNLETLSAEDLKIVTAMGIALARKKSETPICVLDFGGGGGHHYWVAKKFFPKANLNWKIVETKSFCKVASRKLENRELSFHGTIASAIELNTEMDLVFSNSSIQYTDDPMSTLRDLLGINSKIIFITRTPFSILDENFDYFQFSLASENGPGALPEGNKRLVSYRCSAIRKADVLSEFHEKYEEVIAIYEGVWDSKKKKVGSFTVIGSRN
jgi:putative methyltransferase (TIGR04325 family)